MTTPLNKSEGNSDLSANPLFHSAGILNVGNHEILVSSVLGSAEDNDNFNSYDNYDTLDTFEACKLSVDFQKLARLVNQKNKQQVGFDSTETGDEKVVDWFNKSSAVTPDLEDGAKASQILSTTHIKEWTDHCLKKITDSCKHKLHTTKRKLSIESHLESASLHNDSYPTLDIPSDNAQFINVGDIGQMLQRHQIETNDNISHSLINNNQPFVDLSANSKAIDQEPFQTNLEIDGSVKAESYKHLPKSERVKKKSFDEYSATRFATTCNYRYDQLISEDKIDYKPVKVQFGKQEPLVFRKVRKRLVNKYGSTNVVQSNISKRKQHYLSDIYTTLLDTKWRWSILIFALGFLLSWTLFAVIWWLIAFSHRDLENSGVPGWKPCFTHAESFTAAFLFSIETQHTIGFGFRHITPECPEGVLLFVVQAIAGTMIQGFVIGLIFSKLSRPKKRAATLMFSKNAVVCTRDGVLNFLVRIGDMRRSHIIDARTRAYLFRKKVTLEGEVIPLHPQPMTLSFDPSGKTDRIFLGWPSILVHEIKDENGECSPLYNLGARELAEGKFEIVVIIEGMIEASGASMQARTSYLPNEILWGHQFSRLITYVREDGDYSVDYSRFHETVPFNMPTCSARELDILRKKYAEGRKKLNKAICTDTHQSSPNLDILSQQLTIRKLGLAKQIIHSFATLPADMLTKLNDMEKVLQTLVQDRIHSNQNPPIRHSPHGD